MYARNVNEHGFVVLLPCLLVNKSRSLPLDLDTCLGLLLDVLDEHALRPNDLGANVEVSNGFQPNRDFGFRPFTL